MTRDIAVIGAGAAGLMAAVTAGEAWPALAGAPAPRIVVLEGSARPGRKLLLTGGGRCNVTHDVVEARDFNAPAPIVRNILKAFDEKATLAFFRALGVSVTTDPEGNVFPESQSARTILDALLSRCRALGVEVRCGSRVSAIERCADPQGNAGGRAGGGFRLACGHDAIAASRVVLAAGGCSYPRTGSDGSGFDLARRLGHTVTPPLPALVSLALDRAFFHAGLAGISLEVDLRVLADGALVDRRRGALLFTHFGVSGPAVMDASRHWVRAAAEGRRAGMTVGFFPGVEFKNAERLLVEEARRSPGRQIATVIAEKLPRALAHALVAWCGVDPASTIGALSSRNRKAIVHALVGLVLPVTGHQGWDHAEVTSGGVPLAEIDWRTMESRPSPGLHLAGEILDCDGRIGGFNLQWAWSTGAVAGRAATKLG